MNVTGENISAEIKDLHLALELDSVIVSRFAGRQESLGSNPGI